MQKYRSDPVQGKIIFRSQFADHIVYIHFQRIAAMLHQVGKFMKPVLLKLKYCEPDERDGDKYHVVGWTE